MWDAIITMLPKRTAVILACLAIQYADANPCLEGGQGRHPHEKCHQYYDCNVIYDLIPDFMEQNHVECKYPQLYNEETQTCENFENVTCGSRREYFNGCDYVKNICADPRTCTPCYLAFPMCQGLPDAIYDMSFRLGFFVVCRGQRFIEEKQCGVDPMGNVTIYMGKTIPCEQISQ